MSARGADRSDWRLILGLAALACAAAVLSLFLGRSSGGPSLGFGGPDLAAVILREIRVPRTLLALLVGGTLGLCGAALQGLLRNPLAEPGLLGASSGAALGAVLLTDPSLVAPVFSGVFMEKMVGFVKSYFPAFARSRRPGRRCRTTSHRRPRPNSPCRSITKPTFRAECSARAAT